MWVAWSSPCLPQASPKPSHWAAGFSESETITWPCLRGALHELLHDLTLPTIPILLFPSSGEMPTQELCPEAKLTPWSSVSLQNTELFKKRIGFGWKQSMERGKLLNQEPSSTVRGLLSLVTAVTSLCVQHRALLVPMVFTHSWGSNCLLQLLRDDCRNELLSPSCLQSENLGKCV